MKVYIAGPMTGLPNYNYDAFHAAAAAWRAAGWDVANPAEHFAGDQTRRYAEYVEADIAALKACDAIAMLPGWNAPSARGSVWEHFIARDLLSLPVYDAAAPIPIQQGITEFVDAVIPITRNVQGQLGRWL